MALLQQKRPGANTYTFSSQPRAIQQRKKYRDTYGRQVDGPPPYGNIMYDRRIVRGNTYAQHILPVAAQANPVDIQKQQDARKRAMARRNPKNQFQSRTPEPVQGRQHIDVQTELYLEELTDRVEEADISTQTDAFLDRPPTPLYIPAKTGVDASTQILEGELFDFDVEVKPILEVLIGKTVEQALLEVMEEEELSNLRAQQRRFEEMRNAELIETQRLEEEERRHREEKARRMQQQMEVVVKEIETNQKIAARAFAQSYLTDLVPSVLGTLGENGYFFDAVERDIESSFLPWLMTSVESSLEKVNSARLLLDSITRNAVATRSMAYKAFDVEMQKQLEISVAAAAQKKTTGDEVIAASQASVSAEGQADEDTQVEDSQGLDQLTNDENDDGSPGDGGMATDDDNEPLGDEEDN